MEEEIKFFSNPINVEFEKCNIIRVYNKNLSSIFGMGISNDNKYLFIIRSDLSSFIDRTKSNLLVEDSTINFLPVRFDRKLIRISYIKLNKLGLGMHDIKELCTFISKFKPVSVCYKYKELLGFENGKET